MRSVNIAVLKSQLTECLRLVANGETVFITDCDRIVAEIRPPRATKTPFPADAMLADGVREGWLTPALAPGTEPPRGGAPVATLSELLSEPECNRSDR